jgi:hypothetical protein
MYAAYGCVPSTRQVGCSPFAHLKQPVGRCISASVAARGSWFRPGHRMGRSLGKAGEAQGNRGRLAEARPAEIEGAWIILAAARPDVGQISQNRIGLTFRPEYCTGASSAQALAVQAV